MKRLSDSSGRDQDLSSEDLFSSRAEAWLHLQPEFLLREWVPRCEALGLSADQADMLMVKFFRDLGCIYRETNISWKDFEPMYLELMDDLLLHADALKWHLSSKAKRDVQWQQTVNVICGVQTQTKVKVDLEQNAAFHEVYFPDVRSPENVARVMHIFHLKNQPKQSQTTEELVNFFRRRQNGLLEFIK